MNHKLSRGAKLPVASSGAHSAHVRLLPLPPCVATRRASDHAVFVASNAERHLRTWHGRPPSPASWHARLRGGSEGAGALRAGGQSVRVRRVSSEV